jgi:hypothetical protein
MLHKYLMNSTLTSFSYYNLILHCNCSIFTLAYWYCYLVIQKCIHLFQEMSTNFYCVRFIEHAKRAYPRRVHLCTWLHYKLVINKSMSNRYRIFFLYSSRVWYKNGYLVLHQKWFLNFLVWYLRSLPKITNQ